MGPWYDKISDQEFVRKRQTCPANRWTSAIWVYRMASASKCRDGLCPWHHPTVSRAPRFGDLWRPHRLQPGTRLLPASIFVLPFVFVSIASSGFACDRHPSLSFNAIVSPGDVHPVLPPRRPRPPAPPPPARAAPPAPGQPSRFSPPPRPCCKLSARWRTPPRPLAHPRGHRNPPALTGSFSRLVAAGWPPAVPGCSCSSLVVRLLLIGAISCLSMT